MSFLLRHALFVVEKRHALSLLECAIFSQQSKRVADSNLGRTKRTHEGISVQLSEKSRTNLLPRPEGATMIAPGETRGRSAHTE